MKQGTKIRVEMSSVMAKETDNKGHGQRKGKSKKVRIKRTGHKSRG